MRSEVTDLCSVCGPSFFFVLDSLFLCLYFKMKYIAYFAVQCLARLQIDD